MKNKIIIIMLLTLSVILTGCTNKKAIEFKENYESLNNTSYHGTKRRTVKISGKNVFEMTTQKEIEKKIKNKETFYLYIGDNKCPWCRSSIEKADEISRKNDIKKIYYIHIWDKDYNEIFRDKYSLDDEGNLSKVNDGTSSYKYMLKVFESKLENYSLTDVNGNKKEVGEKRIYAPNYFYIENGKLKTFTAASSDKQTDPNEKLTKEILKDQEDKLNKFFK